MTLKSTFLSELSHIQRLHTAPFPLYNNQEGQNYRDKEWTSGLQGLRERGVFDYKEAACMMEFFRVMELFYILIVVVVTGLFMFVMMQNCTPKSVNFTYMN